MPKVIEATDFTTSELAGVIDFSELSIGGAAVAPVTEREFALTKEGALAYEAFMREPVVIKIHKTSNKNEPPVAPVGLNGTMVWLPRERPIRLPRAFVEVLAQSQQRSYSQERNPNPDAQEGMITRRHGSMDYPFEVIEDKHPKGRAWLNRVVHTSA